MCVGGIRQLPCSLPPAISAKYSRLPTACLHTPIYTRAFELELELTQPHMAQKPVLRGEVGCACVVFPSEVVGSTPPSDDAAINPSSSMAISPRTQPVDGTPGVLRTMRAGRQNDAEQMFGGTKIAVCAVLEQHRRREFMSKGSMTRLLGSLHHAAAISNGSMNLGPLPLTADGLANAGGAALAAENEVGVRTALIDVSPLMQMHRLLRRTSEAGPH